MGHYTPGTYIRSRTSFCWHHTTVGTLARCCRPVPARTLVVATTASASAPTTAAPSEANAALPPITDIYISQAYTHKRAVGPIQLDVVPGKGLGWRATRDISTGELLLVSLPIAVLYGAAGEPPGNDELAAALAQSWPRLTPLDRRWLLLLGNCCTATGSGAAAPTATTGAPLQPPHPQQPQPQPQPRQQPEDESNDDDGRCGLRALLHRARALLAEAQQLETHAAAAVASAGDPTSPPPPASAQEQPQQLSEAGPLGGSSFSSLSLWSAAPHDVRTERGIPSPSSSSSLATTTLAPADSNILPPALFGTSPGPSSAVAAAAASDGGSNRTADCGVLLDLVRRYSFTEAHEDPALSELLETGAAPLSAAGLWPELGLLNHSCCPNAAPLLAGGAMYVRAGRPVLAGEEITLSYLGKGVFWDVAERRSRLRASHGFLCRCPRCTAEHHHFPTRRYPELGGGQQQQQQHRRQQQPKRGKQQSGDGSAAASETTSASASFDAAAVLDDSLLAASLVGGSSDGLDLGPLLQGMLDWAFGPGRFRAAGLAPEPGLLARLNEEVVSELDAGMHAVLTAVSRPRQQQAVLLARLEGLLQQVEASCSSLELPPRGRLMVLASVYSIVRLASDLAELSGQATLERRLELLQLVAEVQEAVAPGSDGHVTAAVKAAGVARRVHGADSPAARRAELASASAHLARYGRELLREPALLRRLSATRQRLATGSRVAASMGVLAWLQQVGSD